MNATRMLFLAAGRLVLDLAGGKNFAAEHPLVLRAP
jgi:hypothetical protein